MLFCGSRDFISNQTNKGNVTMSHGLKNKLPNESPGKKNGTVSYRFIHRSLAKLAAIFLASIRFLSLCLSRQLGGNKLSRQLKTSIAIAILVVFTVLIGHTVSAQVGSPPLVPLSQVSIPEPDNIGEFIRNKTAAIALGKTLFWDMQLGTDGNATCATCHFKAGADSRSKNQINPGLKAGDRVFNLAGAPNYQLTAADFPFHKLEDPNNINSKVISDTNDIAGSQGVFRADFVDIVPGSDKDNVTPKPDEIFNVQGINTRRVTDRHSPTVIDAVFNFRNFWDGSAQNIFNGVDRSGLRNPEAFVLKATSRRRLEDTPVRIKNSSLASQAVAPITTAIETAAEDLPIAPLRVDLSDTENTVRVTDTSGRLVDSNNADIAASTDAIAESNAMAEQSTRRKIIRRIGRKAGKKLLALPPLAKQLVASNDSVLGTFSKAPQPGLNKSYEQMIQEAFQPQWWDSNMVIRVNPNTGRRRFYRRPRNRPLSTIEYTLAEYNFSLFFGLAVQAYESTLVSNQTPFDQFLAGNRNAFTQQQQQGWQLFLRRGCIGCHASTELTAASFRNVASRGRIGRAPIPGTPVEDTGFFAIGVRPPQEDAAVGANDEFGNSLSEARLAQQGKFSQLLGENPPTLDPPLSSSDTILADGAFKAPGLRNVELTAPYFHNGGTLTLEQVIDFYSRGGDFGGLPVLNLTNNEKQAFVALLRGMTDERVRFQRAPFDHPQLFVPNGHPGDRNAVTNDGKGQATDQLLEIPAVGRNGGNPIPDFLSNFSTTGTTLTQ